MLNQNIFKRLPLVIALSLGVVACNDNDSYDSTNSGETENQQGSVELQVFDDTTGGYLSGVQATVIGKTKSASSDAEGKILLNKMPEEIFSIKLSKSGYVDQVITVDLSDKQSLTGVNVKLVPYQYAGEISANTGGVVTLADSPAQVSIPANALLRVDGQAIPGKVKVYFAQFNTAQNILSLGQNLKAEENGSEKYLESYAATSIELRDESGALLKLAEQATLDLQIPVTTRADAPATAALYALKAPSQIYYSADWEVDTAHTFTLETDAQGNQYYAGTTTTLGPITVASAYDIVRIKGCVQDELGNPIAYSPVALEGLNYSGYSKTFSNGDGVFNLDAKSNSFVMIGAQYNRAKSNQIVRDIYNNDYELSECLIIPNEAQSVSMRLSWGNDDDLDGYLITPDGTGVYYSDRGSMTQPPYAQLGFDIQSGYGPEVISTSKLMVGDYYYYVNGNSSNNRTVQVELNTPTGSQIFSPTTEIPELYWRWQAFKLTVAENCSISVTPIQKFAEELPVIEPSTAKYCSK